MTPHPCTHLPIGHTHPPTRKTLALAHTYRSELELNRAVGKHKNGFGEHNIELFFCYDRPPIESNKTETPGGGVHVSVSQIKKEGPSLGMYLVYVDKTLHPGVYQPANEYRAPVLGPIKL